MTSDSNDFLFNDQDDEQLLEETVSDFWDVLIVDDDPEIHSVTKLALSGLSFGIRLAIPSCLLWCRSARIT